MSCVAIILFTCSNTLAANAAPTLIPLSARELKLSLAKPHTKASVVTLWATWCAPCKREVPELVEIQGEQNKKGVQVFLLASDTESDLEEAAAFLGKLKVKFPVYRLSEPVDIFMKEFVEDWPTLIPTTLLFNEKGVLVEKWYGRFKIEALTSRLKQLVAAPSKGPVATKPKVGSH